MTNVDKRAFNILSLCSGAGGLELGVEIAIESARTVCYVEREAFAIEHLCTRMEEGVLAEAPVWTDLRSFDGRPWRGVVDIVTAGYPCQSMSEAGKQRGKDDSRYLWPEVARVVGEVQPSIVFCENVSNHLHVGFQDVRADLQRMGYGVEAGLFEADELGAPHFRSRLFVLAVADSDRPKWRGTGDDAAEMASMDDGIQAREWSQDSGQADVGCDPLAVFPPGPEQFDHWDRILAERPELAPAQPQICFLDDGLAADRRALLRLAGNGVCPLQAAYAFISLLSYFCD